MTEDEYRQLVSQAYKGTLLIGLDRANARKFYTDIPLKNVEQQTGEVPYVEKVVVMGAFLGAPLALVASCFLGVLAFGWWAVPAIPLSLVIYFFFSMYSSVPNRWMAGITPILLTIIAATALKAFATNYVAWYFVSLALSLWLSYFVYAAATAFLRAFVLRNKKAWEMVEPDIRYCGEP
jgi:hypothetical protein